MNHNAKSPLGSFGLNVAEIGLQFHTFQDPDGVNHPHCEIHSERDEFLTRIKANEFKEWNERMVKKYDPEAFHHHPNPLIRFVERRRINSIIKLMDTHKQAYVLEIGCGAGNVLQRVDSGKLFGVDISPSILHKAHRRLGNRADLFQGDAQNLPCKDAIFKQLICSEVLEHLLSPSDALYEMARILKPLGVAIISVPNEVWINRIKRLLIQLGIFRWFAIRRGEYMEMPERMEAEWHLHVFSLEEWLDLARKCFKVTRVTSIPFFWLPLRYVIRLQKLR